jgi:hypothetical protein
VPGAECAARDSSALQYTKVPRSAIQRSPLSIRGKLRAGSAAFGCSQSASGQKATLSRRASVCRGSHGGRGTQHSLRLKYSPSDAHGAAGGVFGCDGEDRLGRTNKQTNKRTKAPFRFPCGSLAAVRRRSRACRRWAGQDVARCMLRCATLYAALHAALRCTLRCATMQLH